MIRTLTALVGLLPASASKNRLLRWLGHDVHRRAHLAPSLVWGVRRLELGEDTVIGLGNVLRDLQLVRLETNANIGQFNWISAALPFVDSVFAEDTGQLVLGRGAGITSRHYLDCSGGLSLHAWATVGGVRSTFISHQVDTATNQQTADGITVGEYSLISSNVTFAPGAEVAPGSLVAMGATVVGRLERSGRVWAGTPAKDIKAAPSTGYFARTGPATPRRSVDVGVRPA